MMQISGSAAAINPLAGYFEHINGIRHYPPMPSPKAAIENADLTILQIRQEIERLNKLLAIKLAEESAKINGKTRGQMRAEITALFIKDLNKDHLAVLESIDRKIAPSKKLKKALNQIFKWGCAGGGDNREPYRMSSLGQYVLGILREKYGHEHYPLPERAKPRRVRDQKSGVHKAAKDKQTREQMVA